MRLHGMAWQPQAVKARLRHVAPLTLRGAVAATLRSFAILAGLGGFVWAVATAPHHASSRYEPPRLTIPTYRPPQIDWSYQVRIPKIELPPLRMPKLEPPRFAMPAPIEVPHTTRQLVETRTYTSPVAPVAPVERRAPTDVPN